MLSLSSSRAIHPLYDVDILYFRLLVMFIAGLWYQLNNTDISLEEPLDLSRLGVDVDVQVAWCRGQAGNSLDIGSKRVPKCKNLPSSVGYSS